MKVSTAVSPSSVSRYLALRFTRSLKCGPAITAGFAVRNGLIRPGGTGYIVVEYEPGTRANRSGTPRGLLKMQQSVLMDYEKFLAVKYDVRRNDHDGPGGWNCLIVRAKERDS